MVGVNETLMFVDGLQRKSGVRCVSIPPTIRAAGKNRTPRNLGEQLSPITVEITPTLIHLLMNLSPLINSYRFLEVSELQDER